MQASHNYIKALGVCISIFKWHHASLHSPHRYIACMGTRLAPCMHTTQWKLVCMYYLRSYYACVETCLARRNSLKNSPHSKKFIALSKYTIQSNIEQQYVIVMTLFLVHVHVSQSHLLCKFISTHRYISIHLMQYPSCIQHLLRKSQH